MPKKTKEVVKGEKGKSGTRSAKGYTLSGRKINEAFFNYQSIRREALAKEVPILSHREILKTVSEEWKLIPIEDREKFITKKVEEVVMNDPTQTQINTLKEEQPSASGVSNLQPEAPPGLPMCGLHKEEYKYWCKNCSEWICEFCVTTHSSNGHSCIHLLDFAQGSLPGDVDALFKQTKTSSEVSGLISDELVRIVNTLKKLIATYSNKIKELNTIVHDIEHINKGYKTAWLNFENDLREIRESTPGLILNRNMAKIYEYLVRVDDMKRITQSDNYDMKLLTDIRKKLEEYIGTLNDPLNSILSNIEEILRGLTFT